MHTVNKTVTLQNTDIELLTNPETSQQENYEIQYLINQIVQEHQDIFGQIESVSTNPTNHKQETVNLDRAQQFDLLGLMDSSNLGEGLLNTPDIGE